MFCLNFYKMNDIVQKHSHCLETTDSSFVSVIKHIRGSCTFHLTVPFITPAIAFSHCAMKTFKRTLLAGLIFKNVSLGIKEKNFDHQSIFSQ